MAERLEGAVGPFGHRVFTDSAPVLEVELAQRSGIGWRGKHTLALAREAGSMFFLGEIYVDLPLPLSDATSAHCGSCSACIDVCPTRAIVAPYRLDARRCISYLTIEHHGAIPRELRAAIGTWVFGCDVCQEVCPFNAGAGPTASEVDPLLRPRSVEHALPDLVALAGKGANQLRQLVKRTAMRRVPRDALLRNVAIALGNTHDPRAVPALVALLGHRAPLVRGHAVWALGELGAAGVLAAHADRDPFVIAELTAARQTAATPRTPRSP